MILSHRAFIAVLGLWLLPSLVWAREWYAQPTARLRTEFDDNLRLQANNKQEAYGYQATFLGVAGVRSAVSNIGLMAQADLYRYWGQNNLDRENWNVGVNADYNLTERNRLALVAGYFSDTSLTSEIDSTGVLAGLSKQIGRQRYSVAPSWRYLLSETKSIKSSYAHEEVTYDKTANNNSALRSYLTDSISLDYSHQWREATRYNIAFTAMQYEIIDFATKTDNFSLTFGLEHQYSDTLSVNFMVGGRKTDTTQFQTSESTYGPLFGTGLRKQFTRGEVGLNYMRNTSPSGIGQVLVADNINVNTGYNLTESLKILMSGAAIFTTGSNNINSFNRSYYTFEPRLAWTVNKQFSVVSGYRYRTQEYDVGNNNAASNSIFLFLDYHSSERTANSF